MELSIEILNHPTPFISVQSPKLDQVPVSGSRNSGAAMRMHHVQGHGG